MSQEITEIESEISVEVDGDSATATIDYDGDHGEMVAVHEFAIDATGDINHESTFVGKETGTAHEGAGARYDRNVSDEDELREVVEETVEYKPHADYWALARDLNA